MRTRVWVVLVVVLGLVIAGGAAVAFAMADGGGSEASRLPRTTTDPTTTVVTPSTSTPSTSTAHASKRRTTTTPPTSAAPTTTAAVGATTTLADDDPRIAAAGDIACDPQADDFHHGQGGAQTCQQQATADLVVNGNYDAVLPLGDTEYEKGTYKDYLDSYDPSWGKVLDISRPTVGNHEYGTRGAAGYFKYFGAAAGDPATGYYSYDLGSWHLVSLNSNCGAVSCSAGSEQEQWLRADLAAHPAACTLVYWHHPRWSSGEHGDNADVAPLVQAAYDLGADVVLSGHDHDYERFAPQDPGGAADPARGLRQFVVGTGGRNHYATTKVQPNSEVRSSDTFGVLELSLHPGSYDWRFVPIAGSTFTDSGSQACH